MVGDSESLVAVVARDTQAEMSRVRCHGRERAKCLREKELLGKPTSNGLWTEHTLNNSTGTF